MSGTVDLLLTSCHGFCLFVDASWSVVIYVYAQLDEALEQAQRALSDGNLLSARDHLRKARSLNAKVTRRQARLRFASDTDWANQLGTTDETSIFYLVLAKKISQSWRNVASWLDTVIESVGREELLQSPDGIDILVERYLPFYWDVNHDIVVLSGPKSDDFVSSLTTRGQLQIVVVAERDLSIDDPIRSVPLQQTEIEQSPQNVTILNVSENVTLTDEQLKALKKIEPPGFLSIPTDASGQEFSGFESLKRQIGARFVVQRTRQFLPSTFCEQLLGNLPEICELKSCLDIQHMISGKDILIVSPGPSLNESLADILECRASFVVISLLRALPVLLDHAIVPDFAIHIDAADHTEAERNLIPDDPRFGDMGLFITEYAHPTSFESNFSEFILLPAAQLIGSPLSKAMFGNSPPRANGASVATFSVSLFAELGAASITLVGQDLSISDSGDTYASPAQKARYRASSLELTCIGIDGEPRLTQQDYLLFISEFEILSAKYADFVTLINSTRSGAFLEGWRHLPLNGDHPVISKRLEVRIPDVSLNQGGQENKELSNRKQDCLSAIATEIANQTRIEALSDAITKELHLLITGKSEDMSVLEFLERDLLEAVRTEGSLINFYTLPAKLEADASLESVKSLNENLMVSLDYYIAIMAGARRLIDLLRNAMTALKSE